MKETPARAAAQRTTGIEQWITLSILVVLIAGCYLVLAPFLSAVLWAIILCCTTWPVFNYLQRLLRGRLTLASLVITLAMALVVLAPFVIVGVSLAANANMLIDQAKHFIDAGPPDPPSWVGQIPLIGASAQDYWASIAHNTAELMLDLKQYIKPVQAFALGSGALLGRGLLELTLSIFIAFFLFRDGEAISGRLMSGVEHIAGERGRRLTKVAVGTMRGVVYGILGTALAQGVLAAIGLWLASVPAAPLLGLVTFFFSPLPVGPPLVWGAAAIWLFYQGHTGWAVFLVLWGVLVVASVDNFIKPMIISRGSHLPFILVLLGILGGVVAFGFIGVFIGPTLLAIGFALVHDWSEEHSTRARSS
ncbi:MAG TPA: AI-2E family transporter [Pseudomonadota bacterium]|nr:AI-2E family transporter [Pseudomonadota bacterium]